MHQIVFGSYLSRKKTKKRKIFPGPRAFSSRYDVAGLSSSAWKLECVLDVFIVCFHLDQHQYHIVFTT